jgi:hypothetical protein
MSKIVRTFVATALAAGLLAACNLALPAPIELDGGVFGLDGVPVTLTHDATDVSPSLVFVTDFSGTINESFVIDLVDIPAALRNVFRIASVDEAIGLDVTLVATSGAVLPEAITVSAASLTNVVVKRGVQTVFTGGFSTVQGATMTFSKGPCVAGACTYTANATAALVDISLAGDKADKLAKAILSGGNFTVTASFAVTVAPALSSDTSLAVVLVSLGAVLE